MELHKVRTDPVTADSFVRNMQKAACWVPKISVAMRIGETPVPIPNTKVKTYPAEDTAGATLWESRWPPNS